ncbi:MAG TPA: hypothetical protein VFV23_06555 [Verrucomicrobiae bacterium]|nr:hypothetical protein [Verrucomicrobiae bacterium]
MKLRTNISKPCCKGILLVECVVYIAVFFILLGVGMASFYIFWNHSAGMLRATDDISSALRAGERWRADVRAATGKISVETNSDGEWLAIPRGDEKIVYHFQDGQIHRITGSLDFIVFQSVKMSEMNSEIRGGVTAWRWELELQSSPKQKLTPMAFTFEAATSITP